MRRLQSSRQLCVSTISASSTRGTIRLGPLRFPCALGRSGQRNTKREGDGATPVGRWTLRAVLYRADRIERPRTRLPIRALRPADGWCDAVLDRNYNRPVRHPYPASAEMLWRQDGLYDLIVVLGYNDVPRARSAGSAIFMHVARPDFGPTAGCIALKPAHLLRVLAYLDTRSRIRIGR